MKGFKNITAYIHGKGIIKTSIGIENDKIVYIGDNSSNIEEICKIDGIMVAGFIDEHTHGAGGYDTMDGTKTAFEEISKELTKEGTTAFLATTMTQSLENINSSLKTISSLVNKDLGGATLLGTHLEGPFINLEKLGIHSKKFVLLNHQIQTFLPQRSNCFFHIITREYIVSCNHRINTKISTIFSSYIIYTTINFNNNIF